MTEVIFLFMKRWAKYLRIGRNPQYKTERNFNVYYFFYSNYDDFIILMNDFVRYFSKAKLILLFSLLFLSQKFIPEDSRRHAWKGANFFFSMVINLMMSFVFRKFWLYFLKPSSKTQVYFIPKICRNLRNDVEKML